MRAKISAWARGLVVLAVAGVAVGIGAGAANAVAAAPAGHVQAAASHATLAQPGDVIWS